ncbi:MAG: outer membrane lipoprotein carrier protein LolA [Parvularculaceae bacterium]
MIGVLMSTTAMMFAQAALSTPALASAAESRPAATATVQTPVPAPVADTDVKARDEVSEAAGLAEATPATLRDGLSDLAPASTPAPAFAGLDDEQVVDKVTQYLENLTTLQGDFVQTAPSGAVARGKIYLRRPGQIRFDYDPPSPLTIVATQGMVYVQDEALDQTDSYPLGKTPLKFLLSKKIDLSDADLVGVDRWEDAIAVTYASRDDDAQGELTLTLTAPDLAIEEWAVRDPQNGITVVQLFDLKAGEKVDNRLFRAPDAGGAFINN